MYALRTCTLGSADFLDSQTGPSFVRRKVILKGQFHEIFLHPVFSTNQFIVVPFEMSYGRFDFFVFSSSYCTFMRTHRYFGYRGVARKIVG